MAVKHIDSNGNAVVHKGVIGEQTGCGFQTSERASQWESSNDEINCDRYGCK